MRHQLKETMRAGRFLGNTARLTMALITGLALLGLWPGTARAADPVMDLEIGGAGAISWNISNIKPGDSGTKTVTLHNAGDTPGYLAIWIDAIIDSEGDNPESETGDTAEPGELSQFLTLNISGDNVSSYTVSPDFALPVALIEFPQSVDDPLQLSDQPLPVGDTIQIQWEWSIPPQTTNIIQGDSVSFDIHYILTQYLLGSKPSPPTGGGYYWPVTEEPETGEPQIPAFSDNGTRTYYSPDGRLIIIVPGKTRVISAGDEELTYVVITISVSAPPIPENVVLLTPIYNVATFTPQGPCHYPRLDRQVTIIIYFDKDSLPEGYTSIYAARYDEDAGWVKLPDVLELNQEAGKLTLATTQLADIAVFAGTGKAEDSVEGTPPAKSEGPKPAPPETGDSQLTTGFDNAYPVGRSPMREMLSRISLIVAVSGTLAMVVLAYIERRRRESRHAVKG